MVIANLVTVFVNHTSADSWNRHLRRTRLGVCDSWQRADHDGTGFGLPPCVDDRATVASDDLAVPHPRFWVDWLANRTEHAKAAEVEPVWNAAAELHEGANRSGSGVENGHAVFLNDFPPSAWVRAVGCALVDNLGRAVGKRAICHIGVAGDPANVGCAPVNIGFGVQIEHVAVSERRLG